MVPSGAMKSLVFVALALAAPSVIAQQPGSFVVSGDTLVSAMMVCLLRKFISLTRSGSHFHLRCLLVVPIRCTSSTRSREMPIRSMVILLTLPFGEPSSALWLSCLKTPNRDLTSRTATPMDVQTNPFCAAGMHLPNGSFATFGGNNAVGPGGDNHTPGSSKSFDSTYQDYNGMRAIRIISPCDGDPSKCTWYDSPNGLQMSRARWYPGAEPLADGTVVLIGGFTAGGYINRNYPNNDPAYEGGGAEPTFEFFPSRSQTPSCAQSHLLTILSSVGL